MAASGDFQWPPTERFPRPPPPKRTLLGLVSETDLPSEFRTDVAALSTRTSYLKFHGIMDRLPDISAYLDHEPTPREASYIVIARSLQHSRRAFQEAQAGIPPAEPIVHIQIPTVYDRSLTSATATSSRSGPCTPL